MSRVVAFGAASWNTMIRVEAFPAPEPASIFPPSWHETIGSSGAGKAMNLARLGVEVTLHCLLGDDEPGSRIAAGLRAAGVALSAVADPTGSARHVNPWIRLEGGSRSSSTREIRRRGSRGPTSRR